MSGRTERQSAPVANLAKPLPAPSASQLHSIFWREGIHMHSYSISAYVETIREEIKRIQDQELFYRKRIRPTFVETAAHDRRESRMLEIRATLQRLRTVKLLSRQDAQRLTL